MKIKEKTPPGYVFSQKPIYAVYGVKKNSVI